MIRQRAPMPSGRLSLISLTLEMSCKSTSMTSGASPTDDSAVASWQSIILTEFLASISGSAARPRASAITMSSGGRMGAGHAVNSISQTHQKYWLFACVLLQIIALISNTTWDRLSIDYALLGRDLPS